MEMWYQETNPKEQSKIIEDLQVSIDDIKNDQQNVVEHFINGTT